MIMAGGGLPLYIGFGIIVEDKSLRFTASRWYPEMREKSVFCSRVIKQKRVKLVSALQIRDSARKWAACP